MRPVLAVVVIVAVVTGFVLRAKADRAANELMLDVYPVKMPSDVAHEKGFALWAEALKAGGESSREHDPVIHAVYQLAGVLNIDKRYKAGEGSEEQIAVVGRVEPAGSDGAYTVRFSELGRPPAYNGKTAQAPVFRKVTHFPAFNRDPIG